jgi:hypothetical protein
VYALPDCLVSESAGVAVGAVVGTAVVVVLACVEVFSVELGVVLDAAVAPVAVEAGVDPVDVLALEPVLAELGCAGCVNGFRSRPVSLALLGTGVTVTTGSLGTSALVEPTGVGGTLAFPPPERSTGTAMSATMRMIATGHRCFSRRSAMRFSRMVMV